MSRRVPSVWRPTPADPDELFAADDLDRARRYQRPAAADARAPSASAGWRSPSGSWCSRSDLGSSTASGLDGWVAQLLVVFAALELARLVVDVPLDAWVDLRHDRRWGLSNQTGRGLAADEAKSVLLSFVLGAVLLVPVYALVRSTAWWWLWAWLLVVGVLARRRGAVPGADLAAVQPVRAAGGGRPARPGAPGGGPRRGGGRPGGGRRREPAVDPRQRLRRRAGPDPTGRALRHPARHPPELVEQVVAHELGHVRRHHLRRQLPVLAVVSFVVLAVLGRFAVDRPVRGVRARRTWRPGRPAPRRAGGGGRRCRGRTGHRLGVTGLRARGRPRGARPARPPRPGGGDAAAPRT